MDPYAVFRIPFLSGRQRIRAAYAELCRTEHPDKHGGAKSMEWQMGEWAYRVLMDPQERANYDSARIVRNAMSTTEGILAFGAAVAENVTTFASDFLDWAQKEVKHFNFFGFDPSSLIGGGASPPTSPSVEPEAKAAASSASRGGSGAGAGVARRAPLEPIVSATAINTKVAMTLLVEEPMEDAVVKCVLEEVASLRASVNGLAMEAKQMEAQLAELAAADGAGAGD